MGRVLERYFGILDVENGKLVRDCRSYPLNTDKPLYMRKMHSTAHRLAKEYTSKYGTEFRVVVLNISIRRVRDGEDRFSTEDRKRLFSRGQT